MPRVLIAGCGYVGSATGALFHQAGWEVEGWTSSAESARELASLPFPVRAVDLTNRAAIGQAATPCDAVIQCASSRGGNAEDYRQIYLAAAHHLRAAFPQAALCFTSSTSVYAQGDGEWVTEKSATEPDRPTAQILRTTEEFVLENGGIVARLAGLYGPGRSALLRQFLSGTAVLDAKADRYVNQIHRDDAAAALFLLAQKAVVGGLPRDPDERIFNVADDSPLSKRECYEWLARRLAKPLPSSSAQSVPGRRGDSNKRVSSAKLQAFGWRPRYSTFEMGMSESVLPAAHL